MSASTHPSRRPQRRRRAQRVKPVGRPARPRAGAAPLPRLPRSLPARDLAWGSRTIEAGDAHARIAITPDELSTDARGRLLARAEIRARRLAAMARQDRKDRFWLFAELRLVIPAVHPRVVRRWREDVRWRVRYAAARLEAWRRIEAFLLQHEPEADAWLRRQLAGLKGDPA